MHLLQILHPQSFDKKCGYPQLASAYYNRGIAKAKLKDYQGAIADFSKAIQLDPQLASAYYNRGIAKQIVNDLDGACADWRKAAALGNNSAAESLREPCQ